MNPAAPVTSTFIAFTSSTEKGFAPFARRIMLAERNARSPLRGLARYPSTSSEGAGSSPASAR